MSFIVKLFVFLLLHQKFAIFLGENDDDFTFLIRGGYRPTKHTITKYLVSIRLVESDKLFGNYHNCGGSILSPQVILTAAHCVWDEHSNITISSNLLKIVAGTPNRLERTPHTQVAYAKRILSLWRYFPNSVIPPDDVAIIHLQTEFKLDGIHAQAIEISDIKPQIDLKCTIAGWGRLYVEGPISADVMYGDVVIIEESACEQPFGMTLNSSLICVGGQNDSDINANKGDSGGPLICDDKLFGIYVYGAVEDGYPGVYANVWNYRDWIIEKVKLSGTSIQAINGQIALRIESFVVLLSILFVWIM